MGAASYKRRANKNITAIPIDTLVGYLLLSTGYLSNQIPQAFWTARKHNLNPTLSPASLHDRSSWELIAWKQPSRSTWSQQSCKCDSYDTENRCCLYVVYSQFKQYFEVRFVGCMLAIRLDLVYLSLSIYILRCRVLQHSPLIFLAANCTTLMAPLCHVGQACFRLCQASPLPGGGWAALEACAHVLLARSMLTTHPK